MFLFSLFLTAALTFSHTASAVGPVQNQVRGPVRLVSIDKVEITDSKPCRAVDDCLGASATLHIEGMYTPQRLPDNLAMRLISSGGNYAGAMTEHNLSYELMDVLPLVADTLVPVSITMGVGYIDQPFSVNIRADVSSWSPDKQGERFYFSFPAQQQRALSSGERVWLPIDYQVDLSICAESACKRPAQWKLRQNQHIGQFPK